MRSQRSKLKSQVVETEEMKNKLEVALYLYSSLMYCINMTYKKKKKDSNIYIVIDIMILFIFDRFVFSFGFSQHS